MTDHHPPDPLADLGPQIEAVRAEVAASRAVYEHEAAEAKAAKESFDAATRSAQSKERWVKLAIGAAVALAVIACAVAFVGLQAQRDADADNQARRVVACEQANVLAGRDNAQDAELIDLLSTVFAPRPERTDEQNQQAAEFLQERVERLAALASPLRDCSAAGIEAYFSPDPNDGGFVEPTP